MKTQLAILFLFAVGSVMAQQSAENGQKPDHTDFVTRLDADNDGSVSSEEFDGPADHFTKLDTNSDGFISSDEAPTGPPQGGRQGGGQQGGPGMGDDQQAQKPQEGSGSTDFVTRLDTDGDGKVSSSEFDGPSDHFTQLDTNSDGFIGSDEAPAGRPPRQQR